MGTDVNPDGLEINTSNAANLTTGHVGVFGPDTGWAPYVPAVTLDAALPEPGGVALLLAGVFGLAAARRRSANEAT